MATPTPRQVPEGYLALLPVWNNLATNLQRIYVLLGACATISSIVVATFTEQLGTLGVKIVSFILAVSLGLITAFDLGNKANSARTAWRLLNAAVLAYANDPDYSVQDLYKQYLAGEALLGPVKYNAPDIKPQKPDKE
jgi:hypothetical protein